MMINFFTTPIVFVLGLLLVLIAIRLGYFVLVYLGHGFGQGFFKAKREHFVKQQNDLTQERTGDAEEDTL